MAKPFTDITPAELEDLAYLYVEECSVYQKQHPTASGKIVLLRDRQIPTVDYFLRIWVPKTGKPTIHRSTYYRWLENEEDVDKCDTIKSIEGLFKALAIDIVANEGRGIFYAKNRLGMTDKAEQQVVMEQPLFAPITGMVIK